MWKYIALVIVALLILPQILQVVVLIFYSVIALIENVLDERKESKNEKRQKLQKSTPEDKHEKMPISGWALIIYYVSFHILAYFHTLQTEIWSKPHLMLLQLQCLCSLSLHPRFSLLDTAYTKGK